MSTNTRKRGSSASLNPRGRGLAFGATGLVFYLGCMLTMATVPQDSAVTFFNSLMHGLDVGPT